MATYPTSRFHERGIDPIAWQTDGRSHHKGTREKGDTEWFSLSEATLYLWYCVQSNQVILRFPPQGSIYDECMLESLTLPWCHLGSFPWGPLSMLSREGTGELWKHAPCGLPSVLQPLLARAVLLCEFIWHFLHNSSLQQFLYPIPFEQNNANGFLMLSDFKCFIGLCLFLNINHKFYK